MATNSLLEIVFPDTCKLDFRLGEVKWLDVSPVFLLASWHEEEGIWWIIWEIGGLVLMRLVGM